MGADLLRFVIYGAGAVGGTIGGRLAQAGHAVTLIARGRHAAALRTEGLRLRSAVEDVTLRLPVVERPRELHLADDDMVVLAMKSQDTLAALDELAAVAPPDLTVVTAQNGVANEREALRRFARVIAMCVVLPATHIEPGVVEISSSPINGLLDLGLYPAGVDARVEALAAALTATTFVSLARPDVMRWKYRKLLSNLANAVEAASGRLADSEAAQELVRRAREEGSAVLRAAGIDVASADEDAAHRGDRVVPRPVAGRSRGGGSSWQSLARGTGAIEADYLNGEIVLLGRLHHIPTPVNALLQSTANRLARERGLPGSLAAEALLAEATRATAS